MNKTYELIVVGGGLTGAAAAIAAARENLKVLLIERYGFLGGAATNSQVNPFMGYWAKNKDDSGQDIHEIVNAGIFSEILKGLGDLGGMHQNKTTFNEELLKLLLDRMMKENKVDVLFHSYLIDTEKEDGEIKAVFVANKSGRQKFSANYFIDCTGDADLAALSDCPYHVGREEDNLCQPMTLCFRLSNINMEKFEVSRPKILGLYQKFQEAGKIKNPRENVLMFPHMSQGMIHFNPTRVIKKNSLDSFEVSIAEAEAREQAYELFQFFKNNIEGFEQCELVMSAPQIGVRESRMIQGEYTLEAEDLLGCKKFSDSIARGTYGIDIHSPDGAGTVLKKIPEGEYYTIPYRALIPVNTTNMLVAGRCISSTHEAQSAYRIMPICCCIGEAAGSAISLASKDGVPVRKISVDKLQQLIKSKGGLV